jgi:hypothetical protein
MPTVERGLRDADGARGGLDAGAFEGLHELLEALTFLSAQQVLALHLEVVEIDRVFLHAAIAEHLDLAAGNAGVLPGLFVRARRLLGEEHGQAAVIGRVGHGARQNRHHMGPRGMGDPRLVAVQDPVAVVILHRLRAQAAEVGAGVGLGEDGGRQDLTAGQAGSHFCFCSSVPPQRISSAAISDRVPSEPTPI